jgi:hypothetical protein
MHDSLVQVLQETEAAGYPRVRTIGDMNWALRDLPGTDALIEYEARVNELTLAHSCTFMCVYDINRFSGGAVMDILSTHPMVIMGNRVFENQYYVEPVDFLAKLRRRGPAEIARA